MHRHRRQRRRNLHRRRGCRVGLPTARGCCASRPAILVNTYFGDPVPTCSPLAATEVEGIGIDLVYGSADTVAAVPALQSSSSSRGVVNGRNIWRATSTPPCDAGDVVGLGTRGGRLDVVLDAARAVFAGAGNRTRRCSARMARVCRGEVHRGSRAGHGARNRGGATPSPMLSRASAAALATRATDPRVRIAAVRERLAAVTEDQLVRGASIARLAAQQERLGLPLLPTTTIGSYPQTSAIRTARCAAHRRDRHGRVHPPDAGRGRCRHRAAGGTGPRRPRPRRAQSATTWCGTSPSSSTGSSPPRTGGCSPTGLALRAPSDPLRRRRAAGADDRRLDHLRAIGRPTSRSRAC